MKRRPGELIYATTTDALDAAGYVLKLNADGTVSKATSADVPFGIAYTSTVDPVTNEAKTNVPVAIVPIKSAHIVKVKKTTGTGTALSPGDYVAVGSTAGEVVKATIDTTDPGTLWSSIQKIVGIVVESAGDSDEYVTVYLV